MHLILAPGAMGIFAYLGALSAMGLESIEEVAGASAGSLLGFFICCGKTLDEIHDFLFGIDLVSLTKMNIYSFFINFGFISHEPFRKVLKDFCGDPTFKDLKKKLYVTAYCLNTMETEYFSVDSHPDMSVIDAVCMSMSVPVLFESVKYKGFTYVDGGACENFPMLAFLNKDPKDVVIIRFEKHKKFIPEITNIKDFVSTLINFVISSQSVYVSPSKTILVDIEGVDIFNFSMDVDDKMKLYVKGYQAARR